MTFGELQHAAKARCDFDKGSFANLMALIANCHRGKNQRPYRSEDFYRPQLHRRERRKNMSVDKLYGLKALFTRKAS